MRNSAYSYLDGFFRSPHDAPAKWLFAISQIDMYTAYLDETGQQTNGWIFIAGFLGNEKQWESFILRWKEELGRSQRSRLHMNKLRWKKPQTKELLARLGPIPAECGLTGVYGGVKYSDYEDLVKGTNIENLSKGYLHILFPLLLTMLRYLPEDERVEVIFGAQDRYKERALAVLDFIADNSEGDSRTTSGLPKLAKWVTFHQIAPFY